MLRSSRKLFVHVGPPKTGTSAIQFVLRDHDNSVLIYPKVGLWADGSHHNLVFNFYQDYERPETVRADSKELFDNVSEEARVAQRDVLISSEDLWQRDVGQFVRALQASLGVETGDVEILLACREHHARGASLYNQRVKDFLLRERRTPDAFLLGEAANLTYAPLLRQLANSGFAIKVLNYHPAANFVERFLDYVSFPHDISTPVQLRNVSLSVKGLIGTLAANHAAETPEERARCFAALRRMRPFFAPSRFIFTHATVAAVKDIFRQDREFLRREYAIELPEIPLSPETMFWITPAELSDIAVASADLGAAGRAMRDFVARYVRR